MARKIDTPATEGTSGTGVDDLMVMFPNVALTIAGRDVIVREYGFEEGLLLRAQLTPFLADLQALFTNDGGYTDDVLAVVGTHLDILIPAIAQSAGVEVDWVRQLKGEDAETLQLTWWAVCGPFFMRQILRRAKERAARRHLLAAGAASSPSLSPAALAASPSSAGVPPASSGSTTIN